MIKKNENILLEQHNTPALYKIQTKFAQIYKYFDQESQVYPYLSLLIQQNKKEKREKVENIKTKAGRQEFYLSKKMFGKHFCIKYKYTHFAD